MLIARIVMMISTFVFGHYLAELAKVGQTHIAWIIGISAMITTLCMVIVVADNSRQK